MRPVPSRVFLNDVTDCHTIVGPHVSVVRIYARARQWSPEHNDAPGKVDASAPINVICCADRISRSFAHWASTARLRIDTRIVFARGDENMRASGFLSTFLNPRGGNAEIRLARRLEELGSRGLAAKALDWLIQVEPAALGPVELMGKLVAHISGSRYLLQPDTLTRRQVALGRRA